GVSRRPPVRRRPGGRPGRLRARRGRGPPRGARAGPVARASPGVAAGGPGRLGQSVGRRTRGGPAGRPAAAPPVAGRPRTRGPAGAGRTGQAARRGAEGLARAVGRGGSPTRPLRAVTAQPSTTASGGGRSGSTCDAAPAVASPRVPEAFFSGV